MRIKVLLTSAAGAVVAASLIAAAFVGPAAGATRTTSAVAKKGGTLNFAVANSDVDYSDPALAYGVLSWEIEYETSVMLFTYPDKSGDAGTHLQPEGAAGLPIISKDGKTYTFTIKPGFKFNTGQPVTAANFVAAINRDADPAMNSPVVPFITDIVGVNAVLDKTAKTVSGVTASGNKLTIKLTEPDGGLITKLAMPFFAAIPVNLPHDPNGLNTLPGAGPYYISDRTVSRQLVLKRNPNYKGDRPANADTMVFTMNTNAQQTYLQVRSGQYATDPSGLDAPTAAADLAKEFGINKSRFFVNTLLETDFLALNTTPAGAEQRQYAQGDQLRDRSSGAPAHPQRLRGQADVADSSFRPRRGLLGPAPVPDQGCRSGEGQVARGRQVRQYQPLVRNRSRGDATVTGRRLQPEATRLQCHDEGVRGLRYLYRGGRERR